MKIAPLSRRLALLAAAALLAQAPLGATAGTQAANQAQLAEDAAIWGLPLVQTGEYLKLAQSKQIKFNQFYLNDKLATPWLDLSHGPIVLDVPDTADRYYSIQLVDAYENVFSYVGRRATGTKAATFVLAAPGWHGKLPAGAKLIGAPTSIVFALTRTLVKGSKDLPAAQAVQAAYTLAPLAHYPAGKVSPIVEANSLNVVPVLPPGKDGPEFYRELDRLVRLYPPRGQETVAFKHLAPLGLGQGHATLPLPPQVQQAAYTHALQRIAAVNVSENNDGWRVNYKIRPFITDPVVRAANNQFGPGAHIAEEALYFSATKDLQGNRLDGRNRYTVTFPKGQLPPAGAFWSLILYGPDFYLVDNPINRYTINDRTEGLVFAPDGSLQISIQHDAPKAGATNWLPAPAGQFQLLLRTYQPNAALLAGQYHVPPVLKQ